MMLLPGFYVNITIPFDIVFVCLLSARCILFLIIWVVTGGRHHFWFLPNLTADVGFIDSFRPLYTHEYKGPRGYSKKSPDKTEGKTTDADAAKAQKSDSEEKGDEEEAEEVEREEGEGTAPKGTEEREMTEAAGTLTSTAERHSDTDSDRREDEGSQHSNGNDFEMITREELEQHTEGEGEGERGVEEKGDGEAKPLSVQT